MSIERKRITHICHICGAQEREIFQYPIPALENKYLSVCDECRKRLKRLDALKYTSKKAIADIEQDLARRANGRPVQNIIRYIINQAYECNTKHFNERLARGEIEEYHLKKCPYCGQWVFEHTEYCFNCIFESYAISNKSLKEHKELEKTTIYITCKDEKIEAKHNDPEVDFTHFSSLLVILIPLSIIVLLLSKGIIAFVFMLIIIIYGLNTQSQIDDYYNKVDEDIDNSKRNLIVMMKEREKNAAQAVENQKRIQAYNDMQAHAKLLRQNHLQQNQVAFWKSYLGGQTTAELAQEEQNNNER